MSQEYASSPCQAPPGHWDNDDTTKPVVAPAAPPYITVGLLLFWSLWHTIVWLTNVCDAGKALGVVAPTWAFASGNFAFLQETTARYGTPAWLDGTLFGSVILWEALAATLFWWACFSLRKPRGRQRIRAAIASSLLLWAAFMIADEIFIAYAVEAAHVRLFVAQLATLLVLEQMPRSS